MDNSRWRRVEAICGEALKRSPEERRAYLDRNCGADAALRDDVESLLVHEGTAERFLNSSVGAIAAHVMPTNEVIGRHFGDYEITAKLGEGGMGEVYRARDRKLGRDVAIKILPPAFATDPERMRRFEREARLLATVNHPRIGAIYGVIEIEGMPALVLELVDGETLSVALSRGPLALPRALTLSAQVTEALEHAHRRGIIHRDLKPSNIMLTRDGVKLLDFGIGKWTPAVSEADPRPSTLTDEGAIVGTLHYMSPEQLEGRSADARSDIFSFGAVLFEMLSGRKAFDGPSQASIIAAVMEAPRPRLSDVGGRHAIRLDRIVGKCLAKDADERWQSARDLGDELRWLVDDVTKQSDDFITAMPMKRRAPLWLTSAAALLALTAIGAASWSAWDRWRTPAHAIELPRFEIHPPPGVSYSLRGFDLSQDGKQLLYTDTQTTPGKGRGVWIRRFDRFESLLIPDTADAGSPKFSPDGQWVTYLSRGALRKVRSDGSTPPQVVGEHINGPRGLFWRQPGTILIGTAGEVLRRINADGGTPVEFTKPPGDGIVDLHSPSFLPDGRNMLVAVHASDNTFSIAVQPIDGSSTRKTIVESGFEPTYLSSGHLVFGRGSTILAAPFDATRLEVTGAAVPLVESVDNDPQSGIIDYQLSSSGVLAYIPLRSSNRRTLTWMTSDGRAAPIAIPAGEFDALRVSPDGSRVAYGLRHEDGRRQIWIHEFTSGRRVQMTADGDHRAPIWTRDGKGLIYGKATAPGSEVVAQPLNGEAVTIARSSHRLFPAALTPDSQALLLTELLPTDETFIAQVDMRRHGALDRLPFKVAEPSSASLSPDGRWIAFAALQGRVVQVFVQRFPLSGTPRQISIDGGRAPIWSRDGRTLFFRSVGRVSSVSAVSIDTAGALNWTSPRVLFEADVVSSFADYDVAPDGRLVMIAIDPEESSSPHFNIILNWAEEVRSRVPIPK